MGEIKVSVLMPVKNAEKTLPECIQSIFEQSFKDFEMVLVDDQSQDSSFDLMQSYQEKDRRIKLYKSPGNGIVDALNFGLKKCHGDWVARMDSDDIMHTERLQKQIQFSQRHPSLKLIASQVEIFPKSQETIGMKKYLEWQNAVLIPQDFEKEIFFEAPLAHPSAFFHRKTIMDLGSYRKGDFPEDYELWLRLQQKGVKMAKLPEVLLYWRERPQRLSRTNPRYNEKAFDRIRAKYLASFLKRKHSNSKLKVVGAGQKARRRLKLLLDQGIVIESFLEIDPKKIGKSYFNIPVLMLENPIKAKKEDFFLVYVKNHNSRKYLDYIKPRIFVG